jgi:hypothetical protein
MCKTAFDIFRGTPEMRPTWLGSVTGMDRAMDLANRLAFRTPGDYFVFDPTTSEVVASVHREDAHSIPISIRAEFQQKAS